MKKHELDEKKYYSIREVSRMTGLEPYVLRYWEKEFPTLRPRKNQGGNRLYTPDDIEMVNRINHLRTKEKLTIEGARAKLIFKRGAENVPHASPVKVKTVLGHLRRDVEELLKIFP